MIAEVIAINETEVVLEEQEMVIEALIRLNGQNSGWEVAQQ
jgi:hypothetical protein